MFQIRQRNDLPERKPLVRGFTLLEIMIVIAIMGIIISAGVPLISRAFKKDELGKAVNDIIEGCKTARDRAILQNTPYEFVIREEGKLSVELGLNRDPDQLAAPKGSEAPAVTNKQVAEWITADFPRKLGENVVIEFLDINFIDQMQGDEARVRFYPNGTCDEFTILISVSKGAQRRITTDVVTGFAEEVVQ